MDADRIRRRVLVVDDDEDSASTLALLLGSDGHEVLTALDVDSALETASDLRPELVLLDLRLGARTGYDLAAELRRRHGDSPVLVALTGAERDAVGERCRESGIDGHILKPIQDFAAMRHLVETLDLERPWRLG